MREDELPLLKQIQQFFDCGGVYYQKEYRKNQKACYRFEIGSQVDIQTKVIPFFDKYPLKSQKLNNYLLFKQVGEIVKKGEHKTSQGFEKVKQLKLLMNTGAR
jgi:hypothetical protein